MLLLPPMCRPGRIYPLGGLTFRGGLAAPELEMSQRLANSMPKSAIILALATMCQDSNMSDRWSVLILYTELHAVCKLCVSG